MHRRDNNRDLREAGLCKQSGPCLGAYSSRKRERGTDREGPHGVAGGHHGHDGDIILGHAPEKAEHLRTTTPQ